MSPTPPVCPRCQARIGRDAPGGLCPRCLLADVLAGPAELPVLPAGTRFGDYELGEVIGKGGMGVVRRARKDGDPRVVALKMAHGGALGDPGQLERFRAEPTKAAEIAHPNIVPIYAIGEHEGCPYFTMPLMEGSLAGHLSRLRPRAATMLAALARAVHHAHQHGIIHRDLKPANVLLDGDDNPHVADFGTARRLKDASAITRSGTVVGTASYMAPEQARGDVRSVTTAADVYGLGAILYELLTGRPPFDGPSHDEIRQRVIHAEPVRPRSIDRTIEADLETICLRCLEKQPDRRYGSAYGLAADLERYLGGEDIQARPVSRLERTRRWVRRHPVVASFFAALVVATPTALGVAHRQQQTFRSDVLEANTYVARMAAGTVLFQFKQYAEQVRRAANDPNLIQLLERNDVDGLATAQFPAAVVLERGGPFDSWEVTDLHGLARARLPAAPADSLGKDFSWRDYFRGALAVGTSQPAYVSRAIVSEADGRLKVALAAPMTATDGSVVGVMVAYLAADSVLGPMHLSDPGYANRTAALVGPRDRTRADADADRPLPSEYSFLVHEGLAHGRRMEVGREGTVALLGLENDARVQRGPQLILPDANNLASVLDYHDPFPGFEGRWLAGMAPVGQTGLVIIIQTRDDPALSPERVAVYFGVPFALGLVGFSVLAWVRQRRHARQAPIV